MDRIRAKEDPRETATSVQRGLEVCAETGPAMVHTLRRAVTKGHIARAQIWNPHRWTLEICTLQGRNLAGTLRTNLEAREKLLQQAACGVTWTPSKNPPALRQSKNANKNARLDERWKKTLPHVPIPKH